MKISKNLQNRHREAISGRGDPLPRTLAVIIFFSFFLTACGQSGSLYLPDKQETHVQQ
jgi:hypothetical protein